LSSYSCSLALASAFLLLVTFIPLAPPACSAIGGRYPSAALASGGPLQAQELNYSIELHTDKGEYYVGETTVFQGSVTPGHVSIVLLTIILTDGSTMTRRLTTNETGEYSIGIVLGLRGQYYASTRLVDSSLNASVTSLPITFVVLYRTSPGGNQTTTTTGPGNQTEPSSTTTSQAGGAAPRSIWPALVPAAILAAAVILLAVLRATKGPRHTTLNTPA